MSENKKPEDEWILPDSPIDDTEEVVDKREFLDDNDVDIFKKKSCEKTVEERIKTSRSLKIKHNKWNHVDYMEDQRDEKVRIDPNNCTFTSSFENVEFEKAFHNVIKNSKYKPIFLGEESVAINYHILNDLLFYCYGKLKRDYPLTHIFVLMCEYCGVGIPAMWKRLSSYLQMQMLKELKEISNLPNDIIDNEFKIF